MNSRKDTTIIEYPKGKRRESEEITIRGVYKQRAAGLISPAAPGGLKESDNRLRQVCIE